MCLNLLNHTSILSCFWDEVVATATYLIDRMPTLVLSSISMFAKFFGCTLDYDYLQTLGCLCFPYLCPYAPHKLMAWFKQYILLGYSAFYYGYRCLSLVTSKLHISWRVLFHKLVYPFAGGGSPNLFGMTWARDSSPGPHPYSPHCHLCTPCPHRKHTCHADDTSSSTLKSHSRVDSSCPHIRCVLFIPFLLFSTRHLLLHKCWSCCPTTESHCQGLHYPSPCPTSMCSLQITTYLQASRNLA